VYLGLIIRHLAAGVFVDPDRGLIIGILEIRVPEIRKPGDAVNPSFEVVFR